MKLNGLGAGRLRGSIKDVGMNEKSTEIQRSPFRLRKMEDRKKMRTKVDLGSAKRIRRLIIITPEITSWS